ncbi:MAG TPA: hypothetical protein P5239_09250 [Victivallales bacterium]|nr:hypothetical protein [Victivallales bacterium]
MTRFNPQYLFVLILGLLLIQVGIWNAPLPFGDEAGYISDAMLLIRDGKTSLNLYHLFYVFLLKNVSSDPINAHLICRVFTSTLSTLLMFLFLSSVPLVSVSKNAILITTAFWAACKLNIPEAQFGNINLFALNIVFPAVILLMRKLSLNRLLFLIISLLWAAQIRMEYYIPFSLTFIYICYYTIVQIRSKGLCQMAKSSSASTAVMFFIAVLSVTATRMKPQKSFSEMDKHLLLGLEQCYTSLYSKLNPGKKISTMVEYKSITDDVFKKPTGFFDACRKNPLEVAKYFIINGSINSALLIPALIRHRSIIVPERFGKKGEAIQILFVLSFVSAGLLIGLREKKIPINPRCLISNYRFIILFILCSAATISILLHIPDARYWISCVPLLFCVISCGVRFIIDKIQSTKIQYAVSLAVVLVFMRPMFLGISSNQEIIVKMRECPHKNQNPSIAGLFPTAIGTFAFGLDSKIVSVNEFKIENVENHSYDFVTIDTYFRNSEFYFKYKHFFLDFETNPEKYGYKLLGRSRDKHETTVYALKAQND